MELREAAMDKSTLADIIELVHRHTGITMSHNKEMLLKGRLRSRINTLNIGCYAEYADYLAQNDGEVQEFINRVTTNETSFFRTRRVWDYFTEQFLPSWYKTNTGRTLQLWSAASSSGEEAYSIAICCQEFKKKHPAFSFQILATDISQTVLNKAVAGRYAGRSIENFRNHYRALFLEYMQPRGDEFQVHPELRAKVNFARHNLFDPPDSKGLYDLVFLRNVLIYFEATDQETVLKHMGRAMKNQGTLIIGESESLKSLKCPFLFKSPLIYEQDA